MPQFESAPCDGLILRSVYEYPVSLARPAHRHEILDAVRAREGAADPTAVEALIEEFQEDVFAHQGRVRVAAVTVVADRQQVVIVHDRDEVRRPHRGHMVLLRVLFEDLGRVELRHPFQQCCVSRVIGLKLYRVPAHDEGGDPLVREDRAYAPAAGLFEPCPSPFLVVP